MKAPPATDLVTAELAVFAQYAAADRDADTLLVAVMRGDRVFVARQKLTVVLVRPAICKKTVDPIVARSAAVIRDYQVSLKGKPPGPAKDIDRFVDKIAFIALEAEAEREYGACFAHHLTEQPSYVAVQKQAQALVDQLH